jgi:serine/threonine protein kinase/DNA-binding response OmpR family regulator
MTSRTAGDEFLRTLRDNHLLTAEEIALHFPPGQPPPPDAESAARRLIAAGRLTPFQADAVKDRRVAELIIGNYVVLDRLGAGGMGTVFKARHRRMKRVVALKVLSRTVAQSPSFVQRFQREVEAVARLSHPNIVMAFDADEAEVGHFLVMEFINGRDLATEVEKRGPLPVGEAVACVVQAARALDYAHAQGIVHRDIKPANLLRDVSGVVKVADLGLARFNDLGRPPGEVAGLTQAGTIMGTVDFMPPEQALGLTTIDHRADIYSLGCTLYYLLTAKVPYEGPTLMAVLLKHREGPIPSLPAARPGLPGGVDVAIRRMLAKKPEERFASMAEVVKTLEPFATGAPPAAAVASSATTEFLAPAAAPIPSEATARTIELAPSTASSSGGRSAVLVEPSRTQAGIVRKYLLELGYPDVRVAPSGEAALAAIGVTAPAVVLSAMHLPDMTGVQLAKRMRQSEDAQPGFILITSQDDIPEASALEGARAVRLPKPFDKECLARALAAASGSLQSSVIPAAPTGTNVPPRYRVLVVDDSPSARRHVTEVLAGLGLRQVVEAEDGAAAVDLLRRETFDLVVSDFNMPRLDGLGLLDFIRHSSATPAVPVILVTTETDPAKLEAMRRLGVAAICDKAFRPETVRGVLKRLA